MMCNYGFDTVVSEGGINYDNHWNLIGPRDNLEEVYGHSHLRRLGGSVEWHERKSSAKASGLGRSMNLLWKC